MSDTKGHLAALLTIFIWGTTFISTKILLVDFTPIEILFLRFIIGLLLLCIIYPKFLPFNNKREEILFAFAGLSGICVYYLLENIALIYTLAANVGVIICIAPFFTAIISHFFLKNSHEDISKQFIYGFIVAIIGICCISFNGHELSLNPLGDILAICAALVWAIYSILTKKISEYGYNPIQSTRKTFVYGLIFMLPICFINDFSLNISTLLKPINIGNLLFLGIGASALCFVTWNLAVKILGAIKTSIYIYLVPVITVITSVIVLNEQLTLLSITGTILTLIGLFISQNNIRKDNTKQ